MSYKAIFIFFRERITMRPTCSSLGNIQCLCVGGKRFVSTCWGLPHIARNNLESALPAIRVGHPRRRLREIHVASFWTEVWHLVTISLPWLVNPHAPRWRDAYITWAIVVALATSLRA